MTDFNALLAGVLRRAPPAGLADDMAAILPRYGINTPLRIAHFVGQIAEETGGFTAYVENLNYSAAGLLKTWPSHFTAAEAQTYAHQPEKIANRAYASRNGNGDEASGDGWRYRGRGDLQTTGRANYAEAARETGLDLVNHPELLAGFGGASLQSAAAFWQLHGCNELADADGLVPITRRINGGLLNIDVRRMYVERAKLALEKPQAQEVPAAAPIPSPVAAPTPTPAPEPQPAAETPPAPSEGAPDFTPLWRDLVTMARDRLASFGGGGAAFGAGLLAWVHKLSTADAIMLVGLGLFLLLLVMWLGARKEHRQQAEKFAALNAPAPSLPRG